MDDLKNIIESLLFVASEPVPIERLASVLETNAERIEAVLQELAGDYDPRQRLETVLAGWSGDRPPFVTAPIHENNFYRKGGTPYTFIYWSDRSKQQPKSPPFDLESSDASQPRTAHNQQQVWGAYESLVAWAAENCRVVTSADVVALSREP